jgi:hypothetical protein
MAETIMMVHGTCGGSWAWDNYKSYFEQKGYQCIRPALRYHDTEFENNAPWLTGEPGWQEIAGYRADWLTLRGIMGGREKKEKRMQEEGREMEDRAL